MFNVVLVSPQIPPNTGNIGRLCVNLGAKLHIVKPIGFDLSNKALKRAGLDYWDKLDLTIWDNLDQFLQNIDNGNLFLATTKTNQEYFNVSYKPNDYIIFGSETKGLPQDFLDKYFDNAITIPMSKNGRSLNLSVSVGIIVYEALRQNYK